MSTSTSLAEPSPASEDEPADKRATSIKMGRAVSVFFFVSVGVRALTLVSQVLTAAFFGTGEQMDAYVLALVAPSTIAGILTTSVGAAIIPVFIDQREKRGEAEAMRVLWAAITLGSLLTLALSVVVVVAAPVLIFLLGHEIDPQTRSLATDLLRLLMPIVFLQCLVTAFGAILNAYGRFASSAMLPGTIGVCTIGFLLFAHSWGVYALAWGTVVGYIVNLLLLFLDYLRMRLRFHLRFDWRHPAVRRMAALSMPAMIGILVLNINTLVDQTMAALLPSGNLSAMNFSVKLVDVPSQFFALALSSALLPLFSMQVARQEFKELRTTFRQVTIFAGIVLVPMGALFGVLARPVVELLFERGRFGALSTEAVASAVMFLAPSIFLITCGYINGRMYNALQENWILRNVSLVALVFNVVLNYILMQFWGIAGITFSSTLTSLINTAVVWVILSRKLPGMQLGRMGWSLSKIVVASAVMWVGCALLQQVSFFAHLPVLLELIVLSVIGLLIYLPVLLGMRVPEVAELWSLVRSRLPGRKGVREQSSTSAEPGVTVFCYYYYPYGGGGADRAMQRVAEVLARRGWQLSVVTKPLHGSPRRDVVNGVQVYRTREAPLPGMRFISYMLAAFGHTLFKRDVGAVLHLNQLYLHMPLAIWLRRLRGSRVVVTLQCGGEHGDIARARQLPPGLGRWVLRAARQVDACITLSDQLTEEALEAGFAREQIVQIPNGVDAAYFAPVSPMQRSTLREQLGLPPDRPVVLFAARLEAQKAVDVLLRAWQTVHEHQPQALLALAGDGSLRGQLEALGRDLGLGESVRFLGWTEQVLALYQAADVYVLPSWSEGMPNALLEAMACGLMPVATAIPGTTDVVTHEREGLLVTPGSETELAAALERAISDGGLRASLAAAARQRMLDHFTIEQTARQYAAVYQRAAASTRAVSAPVSAPEGKVDIV